MMSKAWIEVNLDAVAANYREIVKLMQPGARCMAVVKADGYGLGAVEVAKTLQAEGCEAFAVTHVGEGLALRRQGITGTILVLGPSTPEEWTEAIQEDLQLTCSELSTVRALSQLGEELEVAVAVHLKLETGMGRTGFLAPELAQLADVLKAAAHLRVMGMFTHFARAGQRDHKYSELQYSRFQAMVADLAERGIEPVWRHVCNSAAFLDHPQWHHDLVRVGTLLIGHYPNPSFAARLKLQDPWSAKARIVHLRQVPKGTFVGYQSLYRTKRETQLAVIPLGYADGFGVEPHLTPQGWVDLIKIIIKNIAALFGIFLGQETVELHGTRIRVAGKIGMQLTVLDVGMVGCEVGDEVKVPLRRTLANPRLPRIYHKEGRKFSQRHIQEGFLTLNPEYSN